MSNCRRVRMDKAAVPLQLWKRWLEDDFQDYVIWFHGSNRKSEDLMDLPVCTSWALTIVSTITIDSQHYCNPYPLSLLSITAQCRRTGEWQPDSTYLHMLSTSRDSDLFVTIEVGPSQKAMFIPLDYFCQIGLPVFRINFYRDFIDAARRDRPIWLSDADYDNLGEFVTWLQTEKSNSSESERRTSFLWTL